jgi:hypothetical protein
VGAYLRPAAVALGGGATSRAAFGGGKHELPDDENRERERRGQEETPIFHAKILPSS